MAARLAMTAQSGDWGRSGTVGPVWGPIRPSESNQARWPADLLLRAVEPGERGLGESRETHLPATWPGQTEIGLHRLGCQLASVAQS
jgi:hypothetical protein